MNKHSKSWSMSRHTKKTMAIELIKDIFLLGKYVFYFGVAFVVIWFFLAVAMVM